MNIYRTLLKVSLRIYNPIEMIVHQMTFYKKLLKLPKLTRKMLKCFSQAILLSGTIV